MFRFSLAILALLLFLLNCTRDQSAQPNGINSNVSRLPGPNGDSEGYYGLVKVAKVFLSKSDEVIVVTIDGKAFHFKKGELSKVPSVGEEISLDGKIAVLFSIQSEHQVVYEDQVFAEVAGHYTLFVTSTSYTGNLGGLAGADAICASRAALGSKTKTTGGTWRAVLSTNSIHVKDHLALKEGVPIKNALGEIILANAPQLWSTGGVWGQLTNYDEEGKAGSVAWTGSLTNGMRGANHCENWISEFRDTGVVGWLPADALEFNCDEPARIYCLNSVN